ncbi:MAG TPA: M28 family peptidase [Gallionellaceae bacterium]
MAKFVFPKFMKLKSLLRYLAYVLLPMAAGLSVLWAFLAQPLVSPTPSQPPAVDAAALRAHVQKLAVAFYPRNIGNRKNLGLAADYIEAQLRQTGAAVSVQEYQAEGQKYRNIIARFGPERGPLLVIGAHYDSFEETPGADDNASGVAGLLELARLLASNPQQRPIELVAYTLEEPPFFRTADMGSARHAQMLRRQGRAVELMISLEMIGYFSDRPGTQDYPVPGLGLFYPERGNFVALVGNFSDFGKMRRLKALMLGAAQMPVFSINAPSMLPGIDFSDHMNYWAEGYPAIMVTDTAFARNREYHEQGDTWDRLDYARMARVVQGIYSATQGF